MIAYHAETDTGEMVTQHRCPLCGYLWFELTDAPDYPYYCPGCGEQYSPYNDDEIYEGVLPHET